MKHKYVSISNNDNFSTSFHIYVHYSITCILSDILCTTTTFIVRNGANSVNFMTSHQKHISFSLVIIISSIWCIKTQIQMSYTYKSVLNPISYHHGDQDFNPMSYSLFAIRHKFIVLFFWCDKT